MQRRTLCGKFVDYHVFHLGVTVDDKVQNYGLSLIELFIVLMQLNDTIHEGDGDRNVINWKYRGTFCGFSKPITNCQSMQLKGCTS